MLGKTLREWAKRVPRLTSTRRTPIILGIETSCDDTGVAIVNSKREILGESIHRQHFLHHPYGGIVPKLARKSHALNLPRAIRDILKTTGIRGSDLDAVAVTAGPGLGPCLSTGVQTARTFAELYSKPLIGIHHMEAHALIPRLLAKDPRDAPKFPFLSFLVSGGHTLIVLSTGLGRHRVLGMSLDDAAGEAWDKVARFIGLSWGDAEVGGAAGAALEEFAEGGNPLRFENKLTIPMRGLQRHRVAFSFSGLKEAARLLAAEYPDALDRRDIAAGFQRSAVKHLVEKLEVALKQCRIEGIHVTSIVLSGGVACNQGLRQGVVRAVEGWNASVPVVIPDPKYCTDNGAMIAWAGMERWLANRVSLCGDSVDSMPKWPLDELD